MVIFRFFVFIRKVSGCLGIFFRVLSMVFEEMVKCLLLLFLFIFKEVERVVLLLEVVSDNVLLVSFIKK